MDTEKYNEIQEKIRKGKPVSDEGPYYHHVQWEAYKGGARGKLGGAFIGTLIGGVVGGVAAAVLLPTVGVAAAAIAGVAFTGVGLYKGMDEFSSIGKVAGGVAGGLDIAERRNKLFVEEKINELKDEIHKLGKQDKTADNKVSEAPKDKEPFYRLSHYIEPQDDDLKGGPVFWKVAAIGLAVGLFAGALLAAGGIASGILGHILAEGTMAQLGTGGITAVSMAVFGALGASFGINRDIFRQIFDKTDMMFRGLSPRLSEQYQQKLPSKEQDIEITAKNPESPTPVLYSNPTMEYPESDTYHRDKVMEAAKKALLSLDHTKLPPH